jgi:hypothetical protein
MNGNHDLFDPTPYSAALVLIQDPLAAKGGPPDPNSPAGFGTGFFIESTDIVITARHNLLRGSDLLKSVLIYCYEKDGGWIDCRQATVDPTLTDSDIDVALLYVPGGYPGNAGDQTLSLSCDWQPGDDVYPIGLQPFAGNVRPEAAPCFVSWNCPINQQFIDGHLERFLHLCYTEPALYSPQPVLNGFSGGPVLTSARGAPRVIAMEKAVQYPNIGNVPYVLSTPVDWMETLLAKTGKQIKILSPADTWHLSSAPSSRIKLQGSLAATLSSRNGRSF